MGFTKKSCAGAFVIILLLISSAGADGNWTLRFTERDQRYNIDIFDLQVYVDSTLVKTYNISQSAHLGQTTVDLTGIADTGSTIKLRLITTSGGSCASSYGAVMLLYDINVERNGVPVKYTPWIPDKTVDDFRYYVEDQRLAAQIPQLYTCGLGDYIEFATQPLEEDSTEFVLNNTNLTFSPAAWKLSSGDSVNVSATVKNIGAKTGSASVRFYLDGVLKSTSASFTLAKDESATKSYVFVYNGSRIKVEAVVVPTDSSAEGKTDNNNAVRYIYGTRPYYLFRDYEDTYAAAYSTEEPYTSWLSAVASRANTYLTYNFSNPAYNENTKCHNLKDLALQYQKTKNPSYASAVRSGLTYMGSGDYDFLNYSKSGTNGIEVHPSSAEYEKDNYSYSIECTSSGTGLLNKNYHHSVFFAETVKDCAIAFDWTAEWIKEKDINDSTDYYENISGIFMHHANDGYVIAMQGQSTQEGRTYPLLGDPDPTQKAGCLIVFYAALPILDYGGTGLNVWPGSGASPSEMLEFCENYLFNSSNNPDAGYKSALNEDLEDDGLYFEGSYFSYWKHEFSPAIRFYNDVLGINLIDKYDVVKGFENQLPYLMTPRGTQWNRNAIGNDYVDELVYYTLDMKSGDDKKMANYYIDYAVLNNTEDYSVIGYSGNYINEEPLLYDYSSDKTGPIEPSYISTNGSMSVLRSGFGRNESQFNLVIHSSPLGGGHGANQQDSLAFSIYAKGDYLVVDSGDPRAIGGSLSCDPATSDIPDDCIAGQTARSGRGHNTFLIDGKVPGRSLGSTIYRLYEANDNFLGRHLLSDSIDYVETYTQITHLADIMAMEKGDAQAYPINVTREILFPSNEYYIVADNLKSAGSHDYGLIIHLGSYLQEGIPPTMSDETINTSQRVVGNLSVGGARVTWWNTTTDRPIKYDYVDRTANNLTWQTLSENNTAAGLIGYPVELMVSLNPTSEVKGNWSGGRLNGYQGTTNSNNNGDGYHPLVDVLQTGADVKYLTVYYPRFRETETAPTITQLAVTGGSGDDYATRIQKGSVVDTVSFSDGESITAGSLETDGRLVFCRVAGGAMDYFLINNGSVLSYGGVEWFNSSEDVLASLKYDGGNVSGEVRGTDSYIVSLTLDSSPPSRIDYVHFNGQNVDYDYDNVTGNLNATLLGVGDLEVASGPSSGCLLPGDETPCNIVTLAEVVAAIRMWVLEEATLAEVVDIIRLWVSG